MKALASRLDSPSQLPDRDHDARTLHRDLVRGLALHLMHELDDGCRHIRPRRRNLGYRHCRAQAVDPGMVASESPPSTTIVWPLTAALRGEHRNAMTSATSSGVGKWPEGVIASQFFSYQSH